MKPLEPLGLPLEGLVLIEASAGTGKTYTISTLYLRLLLERGLEVDGILVVTFTQAATEELRDRIRRRVAQALEWLAGDPEAHRDEDPVLVDLLLALPDREATRSTLADALTRMDEAAIHTIHGFCQRVLQDHAFESGAAFEQELIEDETRIKETAAADFWRRRVAIASRGEARRLLGHWRTPAKLLAELDASLALDDLILLPPDAQAEADRLRPELMRVFDEFRTLWQKRGDEVRAILEGSPAINRRSYQGGVVARVLDLARTTADLTEPPTKLGEDFARLTPAMLAEKGTKPGHKVPGHPFFDCCGRLQDLVTAFSRAERTAFLVAARTYLRQAMDRRKRDEGLVYFDDLLRRLDLALAGEGADALATSIRHRHPVALIDEFQDTDPQQYRIFRRVYGGQPGCGLFLIGDPKQAIYAFRGADIFTYMQARDDSAQDGHQYTLGVNWRSGSRLIEALNSLFTRASRPFIYDDSIPYRRVAHSPNADGKPLWLEGAEPVPLRFMMLAVTESNQTKKPPGYIRKEAAQVESAAACAGEVAALLNQADAGTATLGDRPLRPGDIAFLVRTHREGAAIQEALRTRGINSVTLGQDSVFASDDAWELGVVLAALAALNDEGLVRAALAGSLLGRNAAELEALDLDEIAWEEVLARFQGYRDQWQHQGFLVAMQSLVQGEGIARRLLGRPDGERRLTNLLQLLELLQVASREYPGIDGLLRWFADQRAGDERDAARQLRLESDEGLVKVVTMHKSKGLEYPVVLIPFPWTYFSTRNQPPPFFHDPADRSARLDLGSPDLENHRALEGIEQLAERLRLFYVAVTRAARLCLLCWGRIRDVEVSALAYLLHPDPDATPPRSKMGGLDEAGIRADLDALAGSAPGSIAVVDIQSAPGISWAGPRVDRERLTPAVFRGAIDSGWRVSSYSALVRGAESEQPDYDAPKGDPVQPLEEAEGNPPLADPVYDLPTGTHAGQLLHQVFEQIDFPQATGEPLEGTVRALLLRYGQLRVTRRGVPGGETDWTAAVVDLVTRVLDTRLETDSGLRLRDIPLADRLTELEFHFPVAGLTPATLQAALGGNLAYRASAAGLGFEAMRGLMRGFIDLVLRFRGRYYLVDYKSNLLGRHPAAYGREGMAAAIQEHRYDLQYLIYTLALHRFLRARLPGYDYGRDFGGCLYLFLRGMHPERGPATGVWHDRPDPALVKRLDRLFIHGTPGRGSI